MAFFRCYPTDLSRFVELEPDDDGALSAVPLRRSDTRVMPWMYSLKGFPARREIQAAELKVKGTSFH